MTKLEFQGRGPVYSHHLGVPYRTLEVDAKKSLPLKGGKPNLNDNLIIHGDNLQALKALMPVYEGKVKCIYIDPPYNTGNEGWAYNDKVNSPLMQEWLGKVVDKDDLCRHDKWLCMMWPRLNLLKDLLADDGVIFVSIDDNEQHRLRAIMDEIFGEENFISIMPIVSNPRGSQSSKFIAEVHEYLFLYAKSISDTFINGIPLSERTIEDYNLQDSLGKYRLLGLRQRGGAWRKEDRPNMHYPFFVNPETSGVSLVEDKKFSIKVLPKRPSGEESRWVWSMEKAKENINSLIGKNITRENSREWDIFKKDYLLKSGEQRSAKVKSLWDEKELNYQNGRSEIKSLFEGSDVFDYPKPTFLVKKCIQMATDKNSLVFDSFAGSGTTAHAVLALNKEDSGNRKFILVQCNEWDKKKNKEVNICDTITAERVRRVIKGVPNAKDENLKNGLGGSFTYATLGAPIDADMMLTGESLPPYEQLARHVFWTATGETLEGAFKERDDGFIGESAKYRLHLIYKPDLEFLGGPDAALTLDRVEALRKKATGKKRLLIFAPVSYMDQEDLHEHRVTFCQLPWAINQKAE